MDDSEVRRVDAVLVDCLDVGLDGEGGDLRDRPSFKVDVGDVERGAAAGNVVPRKQEAKALDGRISGDSYLVRRIAGVFGAHAASVDTPPQTVEGAAEALTYDPAAPGEICSEVWAKCGHHCGLS